MKSTSPTFDWLQMCQIMMNFLSVKEYESVIFVNVVDVNAKIVKMSEMESWRLNQVKNDCTSVPSFIVGNFMERRHIWR